MPDKRCFKTAISGALIKNLFSTWNMKNKPLLASNGKLHETKTATFKQLKAN